MKEIILVYSVFVSNNGESKKKREKKNKFVVCTRLSLLLTWYSSHILTEFGMASCADPLRVIHISLSLSFVVCLHYVGDPKIPAQGLGLRTKERPSTSLQGSLWAQNSKKKE